MKLFLFLLWTTYFLFWTWRLTLVLMAKDFTSVICKWYFRLTVLWKIIFEQLWLFSLHLWRPSNQWWGFRCRIDKLKCISWFVSCTYQHLAPNHFRGHRYCYFAKACIFQWNVLQVLLTREVIGHCSIKNAYPNRSSIITACTASIQVVSHQMW